MLRTDRKILTYFFLSLITCGIYGLWFWYHVILDINKVGGDDGESSPDPVVVLLLTIVTCGIYWFIWTYKQGNRLQKIIRDQGGDCQESGTTYLLWEILGICTSCVILTYFGQHLFFKNMNIACGNYNNGGTSGGGFPQADNTQY